MKNKRNTESGFSLIELMIAIVIIGILATIAVPKYLSVTRKAKETEAKMMLNQLHSLEENYYHENDVYSANLEEIGFEQETLKTEGGRARYKIKIEKADTIGFIAIAESIIDFDKDGVFSIWEVKEDGNITVRVQD